MEQSTVLTLLIFLAAGLYASVGQAGASGYLAAMGWMGVPADVMKPAALLLNVVVSSIATTRFYQAGAINGRLLGPLVVGSLPTAFIGGAINLPSRIYHPVVGVVLLATAIRMSYAAYRRSDPVSRHVAREMAVLLGAGIGMVSGLTGTGGGIFLAPLLLMLGWATVREAAGLSSAFILVNSLAALAGNFTTVRYLPEEIGVWTVAAAVGGLLGAEVGSRLVPVRAMQFLLALLLVVAAVKMIAG
jgi:uncharacterized membrane protein YfcA